MAANKVRIDQLCPAVFGITERRYRQLAHDGVVPPVENRLVDFVIATQRLISYYRKLAEVDGNLSLTDERTRLTKLQADLAEIELAKRNGDVIPYAQALSAWTKVLGAMKTRLLGIPTKYAPLLFGRAALEIKDMLDGAIGEALAELAGINYEAADRPAMARGDGDASAAGKDDGKRVGRRRKSVKRRVQRRTR